MQQFKVKRIPKHHLEHELCDTKSFDPARIVFGQLEERMVPNSAMRFTKIPLYYEIDTDVYSPIYMQSPPECYCYGIQEQKNLTTLQLDGYTLPMSVYHPQSITPDEESFMTMFNSLVDKCRKYLLSPQGQDATGIEFSPSQLDKIAASMSYKTLVENNKKTKKRDPDKGPTFYPKLMTHKNKQTGEFVLETIFSENDRETTDMALQLYKDHMRVTCAIWAESIYIGANDMIRIQFKITEVAVSVINNKRKRFLTATPTNQQFAQKSDDASQMGESDTQDAATASGVDHTQNGKYMDDAYY